MITITEETINKVETLLSDIPNGSKIALRNAANRAIGKAKTESFKGVTSEYAIQRKVISEYTKDSIQKASNNDICATLRFAGTQIPLYKYKPTRPKYPGRNKVFAGQKTAAAFEEAFIARMNSGHLGIFEKTGKKRTPIEEKMGSSMRSMVSNSVVLDQVYKEAQDTFDKRIEHEIERLLAGYGGK